MNNELDILTGIITRRRSVFPVSYTKEEVPVTVIKQILESANYAPTHKLTEPWRFIVFRNEGKIKFARELARIYKETTPNHQFLQKKFDSIEEKAIQSSCIIALNVRLHPEKLPEWEEIAALSCAVQNMALTAEALKVGAYWSSPGMIADLKDYLNLGEREKCFGLFYMGYHNEKPKTASRTPIDNKIKWIDSYVMQAIKNQLYQQSLTFIEQRIHTAETALQQAREASNDDTKSSAGDKYETSREMLQQDIDRNKRLLIDAQDNLRVLQSIDSSIKSTNVTHGSYVITNQGSFYISVSAGQLHIGNKTVFAISAASPIGKLLLEKQSGNGFEFNGKKYKIESVE